MEAVKARLLLCLQMRAYFRRLDMDRLLREAKDSHLSRQSAVGCMHFLIRPCGDGTTAYVPASHV